jgi:UDP-N-acetylmuramate--alanine ligase
MGDELATSLAEGMGPEDRLFLPDPVYQGGTTERVRGSDWLAAAVSERGRKAEHDRDRAAIGERLLKVAERGDRILIMGARDDSLIDFASGLVERLASRN